MLDGGGQGKLLNKDDSYKITTCTSLDRDK